MKSFIALFLFLLGTVAVCGQTVVPAQQKSQIIARIDRSAEAVQTMQCRFRQSKSVSLMKNRINSAGVMYFRRPNKLRWQYTSPYDYTFIMNGTKAYLKSARQSTVIDVKKNKMFRQVTDVIMGCMIGGNMSKTSYFKINMYRTGNTYYANLVPVKKEFRQFYASITLYFNQQLTMVDKVEMKEKNGDTTTIILYDTKINGHINDKVFNAD